MAVNYKKYRHCNMEGCDEVVSGKKVTCDDCLKEKNRARQRVLWKNRKPECEEKVYMGHLNQ